MSGGEYVRVAGVAEIPHDRPLRVLVDGDVRILVRDGDGVHALDGICTHQHAELAEGEVEDGTLWCSLHGAGFDVRTGEAVCPPAVDSLRRYDVRLDGEHVLVSRRPV